MKSNIVDFLPQINYRDKLSTLSLPLSISSTADSDENIIDKIEKYSNIINNIKQIKKNLLSKF